MSATGLSDKEDEVKTNTLLHVIGPDDESCKFSNSHDFARILKSVIKVSTFSEGPCFLVLNMCPSTTTFFFGLQYFSIFAKASSDKVKLLESVVFRMYTFTVVCL
jgi:hypothetical protein